MSLIELSWTAKDTVRDGVSKVIYTVYTVYTIQTALHCLNSSKYAYYILLETVRTLLEWVDDGLLR